VIELEAQVCGGMKGYHEQRSLGSGHQRVKPDKIELVIGYMVSTPLPLILQSGIATAIDTLAGRWRDEWAKRSLTWRIGADLVTAWTFMVKEIVNQ
jgi:hypothetical protein